MAKEHAMRVWGRLALIIGLLAGLLTAPAMALGVGCHDCPDRPAMRMAMPADTTMAEHAMQHSGPDARHKGLSCAIHCLGAGAAFLLPAAERLDVASSGTLTRSISTRSLDGRTVGPALEPPIDASV